MKSLFCAIYNFRAGAIFGNTGNGQYELEVGQVLYWDIRIRTNLSLSTPCSVDGRYQISSISVE
jgi:hypothetical protein